MAIAGSADKFVKVKLADLVSDSAALKCDLYTFGNSWIFAKVLKSGGLLQTHD